MEIIKSREIFDAEIEFVSLVDKAANKKKFLITKAASMEAAFSSYGDIIKVDCEKHYITGIVYEPMVEDSQGDFMSAEEIRRAAYWFAKNGDKVDLQHTFKSARGVTVVENFVTPWEIELNGTVIKSGTWLITVEVENDDIWEAVMKGEITGFSMGGTGKFSKDEVFLDEVSKTSEQSDCYIQKVKKKNIFKKIADEVFEQKFLAHENNDILKEVEKMTKEELMAGIEQGVTKAFYSMFGNNQGVDALCSDTIEVNGFEAARASELLAKMIDESVKKAVEPLKKAQRLPTCFDYEASVAKNEAHFLKGII